MRYRRVYRQGGAYFFTVVTARRRRRFVNADTVALLGAAFRHVKVRYPFAVDAVVILPDHLHCIWTLPETETDYSLRWRLIKAYVTKRAAGVHPFWQPRFWEHTLRDTDDYARHMDYIHYNPVKHGLAATPAEWPYSSFSQCVDQGLYTADWGRVEPLMPDDVGHE